ncbi:MAG: peptide deformylase [Pirellulales bacterium]|nr:peptide deformylase [Pirellulales bacterium]
MRIIQYPHPTLRHVSKPLRRVDAELRGIVQEMLALMYAAQGIGLAANQVDLPYRMFVLNVTGEASQSEAEMVFLNPVITARKGMEEAEEGCLSLPGVFGQVKRPDKISVTFYDLEGQARDLELSGLAARAVQHEVDHLDGTLFIDRLTPTGRLEIKQSLDEFEIQFAGQRTRGELPGDADIAARLAELERLRT